MTPYERAPHPPIEPHDQGLLDVGDGQRIHWQVAGNPDGMPALVVHGGPGSGASPWWTTHFDAERYRIVLFDQRNCGRSLPHASEPDIDLSRNTTAHVIGDMERLREHLGIDRWLLFGGSWGSGLSLAYAVEHPERVSRLVLFGIATTRAHEIEWLTRGVATLLPDAWERFAAGVAEHERDGNLAAAYHRRLMSDDPAVRERAALDWADWEDALLGDDGSRGLRDEDPAYLLAFTRIVTHYFANAAFLPDDAIIGNLDRIAHIPSLLVHGRRDISSPLATARELAARLPMAELVVVDEGHAGAAQMTSVLIDALDQAAAG